MNRYAPILRGNPSIPRAGSPAGDKELDEFAADMLDLMGDPEFLWTPQIGDATTLSN